MSNPPILVEEYLGSSFEYDCELVDGVLVDRTGGELDHSIAMAILGFLSVQSNGRAGLIPLISVRVRTRATRIRVPDLAVIRATSPRERIVTYPPVLAVEVRIAK
jgi:Uma2 family endonuclease